MGPLACESAGGGGLGGAQELPESGAFVRARTGWIFKGTGANQADLPSWGLGSGMLSWRLSAAPGPDPRSPCSGSRVLSPPGVAEARRWAGAGWRISPRLG